ncbi:hypothetical protein Tco_0794862 [Tanacetum coccineum]
MNDPNITMEEYIRLEEEKAHRHGKVYNWETATYGRIWYDDDVHDLRSVETEFPAIVFNDTLTSEVALSCKPTIIYVDDLKTDSENDNDKVNTPSFLSAEPTFDFADMALPPRDQRHKYLRFEGLEYTDADIADFEERLEKIYGRGVHRVHVFDFRGLTDLMAERLSGKMLMGHMDAQGQSVFTSRAWRRLFEVPKSKTSCLNDNSSAIFESMPLRAATCSIT